MVRVGKQKKNLVFKDLVELLNSPTLNIHVA